MSRVSPNKFVWGENKNWAIANKNKGTYSLVSGIVGTVAGCAKSCTKEDALLSKVFSFIQSVAYGLRSNFQYSIYSRKDDDDLGEDIHARPHAANIGEVACFVEKKVNPIALPLSVIFGNKVNEGYGSVAHWFNALWWRLRLCSKKINWKSVNLDLASKFKDLFNKDYQKRLFANIDIEEVISPLAGIIGFFSTAIFTPIKSWFKFRGIENKLIDSVASIGVTTQHIAYLFRFTLSELFNFQRCKSKDSKVLFGLGSCANALNIGLPIVELLPCENRFLGTAQKLYKELATGFTASFFSTRRHFMGKEWLENNNENNS